MHDAGVHALAEPCPMKPTPNHNPNPNPRWETRLYTQFQW